MMAQKASKGIFYSFFNLGARREWELDPTPTPEKQTLYPLYGRQDGSRGRSIIIIIIIIIIITETVRDNRCDKYRMAQSHVTEIQ
jgi:hypothetical protein